MGQSVSTRTSSRRPLFICELKRADASSAFAGCPKLLGDHKGERDAENRVFRFHGVTLIRRPAGSIFISRTRRIGREFHKLFCQPLAGGVPAVGCGPVSTNSAQKRGLLFKAQSVRRIRNFGSGNQRFQNWDADQVRPEEGCRAQIQAQGGLELAECEKVKSGFAGCARFIRWSTVAVVGRLAQWLARLPYTQLVGGSSPSAPTIFFPSQNSPKTLVSLSKTAFQRHWLKSLVSRNTIYFALCLAASRSQLRHGQPI